eukprot:TRINITY_DN10202_c0_g1_i1.p2 TRINITY_DN10202_c0_g1~~TRINITY_DN10202_c0_g1_i1.p2  ORF type:complete len:278 (+),score=82.62 TRINITY_DN10202_c0_g1_i1:240-1073(+)
MNVEYNQIDALLKSTEEFKEGDVADSTTGLSPWPGSINELIFQLDTYHKVLDASGGAVPEFVNPKYVDGTKTKFKSPTRLECMMQDLPRLLVNKERVGFTSLYRAAVRQYSPVKNKSEDAAEKQKFGLDPACAGSGEMDVYRFNCDCLTAGGSGMTIADGTEVSFDGIALSEPPKAVLSPGFLLNVKTNVIGGSLGVGSTLVVDGDGVTLEDVHVEAGSCLEVYAAEGSKLELKGLRVQNDGWRIVGLTEKEREDMPEEVRIRGFKVLKRGSALLRV